MVNITTIKTVEKILTNNFTEYDLEYLLNLEKSDDIEYLYKSADKVCRENYGDNVYIRGIIEFSNICKKNCNYCGIRRANDKKTTYRIEAEDIIKLSDIAYQMGYRTIVLQSGEDSYYDDKLEDIIKEIKSKNDIAITISVGEKDIDLYKRWKKAGADRYLMRIETTNEELFESLHPDDNLELRKSLLFELKKMGYETGTGIMVGLPNQTKLSIAKDILFFKELDADMLGIGPFIPHEETPMANERSGNIDDVLKTVAVMRLVLPKVNIPATTAMGSLDPLGRQKALMCGANVIMPNVTPQDYRPNYQLYNNKICIFEGSGDCRGCVEKISKYANKVIKIDKGFRKK